MKKFNIIAILIALLISMQGTAVFAAKATEEATPITAEETAEVIDEATNNDAVDAAEESEDIEERGKVADKKAVKAESEAKKAAERAKKEAEKAEKEAEEAAERAKKEAQNEAEKAAKDAEKKEKAVMKEAVDTAKETAKSKLKELKSRFKTVSREYRRQILNEIAAAKQEIDDDEIDIFVKNGALDFSKYDNVLPEIENDRTLVPIRAVIEAFNADILWESATSTITITSGDTVIKMQPGNNIITINGVETELECAPKLVRDRTLVPIRIIAEALHMNVEWDEDSKTIIIDDAEESEDTDTPADTETLNDTDVSDDIDSEDDIDTPEDVEVTNDTNTAEDEADDADVPAGTGNTPDDEVAGNDTADRE